MTKDIIIRLNNWYKFLIIFSSSFIILVLSYLFTEDKRIVPIAFLILLLTIIVIYIKTDKRRDIFDPFKLFSFYYLTIVLVGFVLVFTKDLNSIYFISKGHLHNTFYLLNLAIFYYLIGYIFALLGYKLFVKDPNISDYRINYTSNKNISDKIVKITIIIFISVGILNFLYNVKVFSHGNIINYYQNISLRSYEFKKSGITTFGYLLSSYGIYLWLFYAFRRKKKITAIIPFFIITLLIRASEGKVFFTLIYLITFLAIIYYRNFIAEYTRINKKYLISILVIFVLGILFYFYRVYSNLLLIASWNHSDIKSYSDFFNLKYINQYLIFRGNLPNIPVFMKIIDSWSLDHNFFYGKSFIKWMSDIIPSLKEKSNMVSVIIKESWYFDDQGGALPPTGVGEMYINFGSLGPIIGMFIFGSLCAVLKNLFYKLKNFWMLLIYVQISISFCFLFAKGDFDNMSMWFIFPILLIYIFLRFGTKLMHKLSLKYPIKQSIV